MKYWGNFTVAIVFFSIFNRLEGALMMTFILTFRILTVLCLKDMSCLCFRWEMFPLDGGSDPHPSVVEMKSLLESRKEVQPVNAQKERRFPITVIYSLYINHPKKKSISCVLHRKEFKVMSLQCISHIQTMKSYKTFTRAGNQDSLGSLLRWKNT